MNNVQITPGYKPEDVPRLLEINHDAYDEDFRPPERTMKSMLQVCEVWTAKNSGGLILGFIMVESFPGYIWSLAVDSCYRNFGIGRMLVEAAVSHFNKPLELHVSINNPAQKLYFDAGFRVGKIIAGYYPTEAALLMRRPWCLD